MTEALCLNNACLLLGKSNSSDLKGEVMLQQEFLEPFRFFRDKWLLHPRGAFHVGGPEVNLTAGRVVSEYKNGINSKYVAVLYKKIPISNWKEVDFYIHFILRVIHSFQVSGKPLKNGFVDNLERVAKGVHWALLAVIYWYKPAINAMHVQRMEERMGPSRHTAQSLRLKSIIGIDSPVSRINCIIKNGQIIFSASGLVDRVDLSKPVANPSEAVTPQDEASTDRPRLEGKTEDVGLSENEEFQTTGSNPSTSHRTTPFDSPAPKRPRTKAELLERINTEKARFNSLVQACEGLDTVGEAAQSEATSKYGYLQELCVEYRNHWGIYDAPEPPQFPEKLTCQVTAGAKQQ